MVAKVMALQHIREASMDKLRDDLADVREVVFRDFADFLQTFPFGAQAENFQFHLDPFVPVLLARQFDLGLLFLGDLVFERHLRPPRAHYKLYQITRQSCQT